MPSTPAPKPTASSLTPSSRRGTTRKGTTIQKRTAAGTRRRVATRVAKTLGRKGLGKAVRRRRA